MRDYSHLLFVSDAGQMVWPTYHLTMVSLSIFLDTKNTTIAPDKLAR